MNYESILDRANELYRASKGEASNYMHVEIRSDQVKSILRAVVEAIIDREKQSLDCAQKAIHKVLDNQTKQQ
jgi:hypothetical protein